MSAQMIFVYLGLAFAVATALDILTGWPCKPGDDYQDNALPLLLFLGFVACMGTAATLRA